MNGAKRLEKVRSFNLKRLSNRNIRNNNTKSASSRSVALLKQFHCDLGGNQNEEKQRAFLYMT